MPETPATIEQTKPSGTGRDIADLVVADIIERKAVGTARYGEPLRPFNGRSALVDGYQEALDLSLYLRQRIEEEQGAIALATSSLALVREAAAAFAMSETEREQHFDVRGWLERARALLAPPDVSS